MKKMSKVIIDGDIVAYRMAFANKDKPLKIALIEVDTFMSYILSETSFYTNSGEYQVYLTGKGNFREEIAKTAVYKGNRKGVEKPVWLSAIRDHLVEAWDAEISCGQEADDLIAIEATKFGNRSVVASADKDMLQIPAFHFNFNTNVWKNVDEDSGLKFFYTQILTGDAADNIKGLYRVGPKKAEKILEGLVKEEDLWDAVLKAYDGDRERVIENARLLWLRREEGELWQPLDQRKQKAA